MYQLITLYLDGFTVSMHTSEAAAIEHMKRLHVNGGADGAAFLYGPNGLVRSNLSVGLQRNLPEPTTRWVREAIKAGG